MFEDIIFPIIMILGGIILLKILYIKTGGFLKEDMFSNSQSLGVWGSGIIIIIVGIIFLIKGLVKYF